MHDARCALIGNSSMIIITIIIIKGMNDAPDLSKNMTVLDVCNSRAIINKIHQHTHFDTLLHAHVPTCTHTCVHMCSIIYNSKKITWIQLDPVLIVLSLWVTRKGGIRNGNT